MERSLQVLSDDFFLIHIPPSSINSCLKYILRLMLYPQIEFNNNADDCFFCFTSTQGDPGLSLILNHTLLQLFPKSEIIIGPNLKAIKIYEGPDAINNIGYIRALSDPLSKEGIDPIYFSTYSYDFIFVNPNELNQSITCLKQVVGTKETHWDTILKQEPKKLDNNIIATISNCSMAVSPIKESLSLFTLPISKIKDNMLELLRLILYPIEKQSQFLSYTVTGNEVTILVNTSATIELRKSKDIEFNSNTWSCIEISNGSSLEKGGSSQVYSVSTEFYHEKISLYYLSTFTNDYTIVPEDKLEIAVNVLKNNLGALVDENL